MSSDTPRSVTYGTTTPDIDPATARAAAAQVTRHVPAHQVTDMLHMLGIHHLVSSP